MSGSLSLSIGVQSTFRNPSDFAIISQMASDQSIPRPLAALAEIQICAAKYAPLVSESAENHLATSLERNFKHELDLVKDRFVACWTPDIEFAFHVAKLYLVATLAVSQGRQLYSTGEGSSSLSVDPSLLVALSDGFNSAIRLIQIMCLGQDRSQASNPLGDYAISCEELHMQGLPKLFFRALFFASLYLLRFHVSVDATHTSECTLARTHVDIVYNYLCKQSTSPNDECGRAAAVVDTLSKYAAVLPTSSLDPMKIKERLGASIFYDALTRAHELRARPVQLLSDRDKPQQTLVVTHTTLSNTSDPIKPSEGHARELDAETTAADGGYLESLPQDWFEHLDLDLMGLSGNLFTGAASCN